MSEAILAPAESTLLDYFTLQLFKRHKLIPTTIMWRCSTSTTPCVFVPMLTLSLGTKDEKYQHLPSQDQEVLDGKKPVFSFFPWNEKSILRYS